MKAYPWLKKYFKDIRTFEYFYSNNPRCARRIKGHWPVKGRVYLALRMENGANHENY